MSVRVLTKDIGVEVKDVYRRELGFKWQLEDGVEEHTIRNLGRFVV